MPTVFAVYHVQRGVILYWTRTHPVPTPRGVAVFPADEGQWAPPEGAEIRD
jgi:hypothetical protein